MNQLTTTKGDYLEMNTSLESNYTNTLSENTKRIYLITICAFFNVKRIDDISLDDIRKVDTNIANAWVKKLQTDGLSSGTINNKLAAMKNFYRYLSMKSVGIMPYNPFSTDEGCVRLRSSKDYSDQVTLTSIQVNALIRKAGEAGTIESKRNKIILSMLATTGMRRSEVVGIKINDIHMDNGRYFVSVLGKGNKVRKLEIARVVYRDVVEYVQTRGLAMSSNDYLFVNHARNAQENQKLSAQSVYNIVKMCAEETGLDPTLIHPHTMRHTYATTVCMNDLADDKTLQQLMGHSSWNTTNRYINATKMIEDSPSNSLAEMFMG